MNATYRLYDTESIRIAPDGFSFYKPDGDKTAVRHFANTSGALLSTEAPQFFGDGTDVTVVVARHIPMLVPAELYDSAKDHEYLSLQYDISRLGATFADTMGAYKAVYFLTQNETDTLNRLPFPYKTVAETTLLHRFLCAQGNPTALFVAANHGFTDIVVTQKEEPLLVNRFSPAEAEDTLYHVLNIVKQYNLRQPALYLRQFGEEGRKLPQLLKTYNLNPVIL